MRLQGSGLSVDLPSGWEGEISGGGGLAPQGARRPTVAHFANFPLPGGRSDFGSETIASMHPGDAFVALFEYGLESAGRALFGSQGVPRVRESDFDRNAIHHAQPGQSGLQRFFTVGGRPFSLYVVVGSHIDRSEVVDDINRLLSTLDPA